MAENKLALLKESVSFTKSNEDALMKGDFEVYDDRIVAKSLKGSLCRLW